MRFRTTQPHYIDDRYIAADTEIGTGTQYPLPIGYPPTAYMVPLDGEAEAAIGKANPAEVLDPTDLKP